MSKDKSVQKFLIDLNRRRFLSNSASAVTGAAVALASGKRSWYAWADAQAQRPCLISIHLPAGWDTNWFHMAFPKSMISTAADNPNLIARMPDKAYDTTLPTPAQLAAQGLPTTDPYGRLVDHDDNGVITQFYHGLYSERTANGKLVQHPNAPGHYAGLGLQHAFSAAYGAGGGTLDNFFNKVCVWKGLYSGGAHQIPNVNIIHGSTSQYAISFSGLIAESLAARFGKLKLNYVQLTSTPSEYGANWAMSKGDQIPINCADHLSLKKLTARDPSDFASDDLYGLLNQSVLRLGGEMSKNRFSLSQSKGIYDTFTKFFQGALDIAQLGTNMTSFLGVWQTYAEYARDRLSRMHDDAFIQCVSPEVVLPFRSKAYNYHLMAPYQVGVTPQGTSAALADNTASGGTNPAGMYETDMQSYVSTLSASFTADETSLNLFGQSGTRALVATIAWKFALAEFLIVNGFSSVVDMMINTGDHHDNNSDELHLLMIIFSCYAKLLDRLKAAGYLDRTLIVAFSEFDRTANLATDTSMTNRGTGHDITESILLAGYGVKQGSVVGDRTYPAAGSKPITFTTKSGGTVTKIVDYTYVFPTIMKIFGVTIPAQQITDAEAVDAVTG